MVAILFNLFWDLIGWQVHDGVMPKLLQSIESTVLSSAHVKSTYELEYQSLTDDAYKYIGLFLSDPDDDKLHDLADEICANAVKIGKHINIAVVQ